MYAEKSLLDDVGERIVMRYATENSHPIYKKLLVFSFPASETPLRNVELGMFIKSCHQALLTSGISGGFQPYSVP